MTNSLYVPASLTPDDIELVEQLIAKLSAIRAAVAELERREKTERGSELTEDSGL